MNINKKLKDMAFFIEFIVGAGLAIFFHLVLHDKQSAYIIFGLGILLSIVTFLLREDIEKTRASLLEQYHHVHEIPFALSKILDPECQAKAQELIAGTKRTIKLLQQGYIPLDESEFYLEGAHISDNALHHIKAVDPLTTGKWARGALINFHQANLRALDRGVRITRIFVISRADLSDPEAQKVILAQYRDNIEVRLAYRDELPTASYDRDTSSSFDFAIYDDHVVIDVFGQPGKYYGKKTCQPAEVARSLHLYNQIDLCTHSVVVKNDKIILAADIVAMAS